MPASGCCSPSRTDEFASPQARPAPLRTRRPSPTVRSEGWNPGRKPNSKPSGFAASGFYATTSPTFTLGRRSMTRSTTRSSHDTSRSRAGSLSVCCGRCMRIRGRWPSADSLMATLGLTRSSSWSAGMGAHAEDFTRERLARVADLHDPRDVERVFARHTGGGSHDHIPSVRFNELEQRTISAGETVKKYVNQFVAHRQERRRARGDVGRSQGGDR